MWSELKGLASCANQIYKPFCLFNLKVQDKCALLVKVKMQFNRNWVYITYSVFNENTGGGGGGMRGGQ